MKTIHFFFAFLAMILAGFGAHAQSGIITTVAGGGTAGIGDGGAATNAQFNRPQGIAIDASGNMYVADEYHQSIRKVNTYGVITTIAGNSLDSAGGFSGDGGAATNAVFSHPCGVAVDHLGNIYVTDYLNNRVRKIDYSGIITTVAGNGIAGYSGDGGPATNAELF
jgi:DNA-binding beta-propeller fold protein YncE